MSNSEHDNQSPLMSLKEVCQYLGVSKWTVYRLIKSGQLPAIKVGGQWKFLRKDVEEYLAQKKFRYWTTAIEHHFFRPKVLEKYRQESMSTQKYYLHEQANDGWVGSRQDAYDVKVLKSAKKQVPAGYLPFVDVHFRKDRLKDGSPVILLTPKQFQNLPNVEQKHWGSFLITHPEV